MLALRFFVWVPFFLIIFLTPTLGRFGALGRDSLVWGWGLENPGPISILMASEGSRFTVSTSASLVSRRVPQLPQMVNSAGREVLQLGQFLVA